MYKNVGKAIKGIAIAVLCLGILAGIVAMLRCVYDINQMTFTDDSSLLLKGIFWFISGVAGAFIASTLIFGFGELVEKTISLETELSNIKERMQVVSENTTLMLETMTNRLDYRAKAKAENIGKQGKVEQE